MVRILEGVRVVEVASWTFVPAAGALLADWGADVVKIEHPERGDPQRGLVTSMLPGAGPSGVNFMMEQSNRGKRGLGLDVGTEDGRRVLRLLVERADVFLTNMLGPVRRKLALDVSDIREMNPDIIYARGSGQGSHGRDADLAGYDNSAYWARGGLAYALTPSDLPWPIGQRAGIGDLPGGLALSHGIVGALLHRTRTGEALIVDGSLLGFAVWQMAPDIMARALYPELAPMTYSHSTAANPLANAYKTADGRVINLVMMDSDRFWPRFCHAIDRTDLEHDPRFVDSSERGRNNIELIEILEEVFARRTVAEWRPVLDRLGGAWAVVQSPGELLTDPQVLDNGYLSTVDGSDGRAFPVANGPVQFNEEAIALTRSPGHGEHTEEILLELGIGSTVIDQLRAAHVVN
jgi:crotonobetainyl-CoA:carnitine CoA-transferase CaiB-like acyl-CoA transferase